MMDTLTSDTIFAVAVIVAIVVWHWINKKYGDDLTMNEAEKWLDKHMD